ncbi:ComEA family DNA-binding protein [Nonomuraea sp. NPDC050783]|uniref:ComEA family DNA-binding protein n=1 Tax=Nonomuraea sp. NPDC050783 TaxID=3154634 RepID=UPI003466CC68
MRTSDPAAERAIAESRLRSIISPPRHARRLFPYRRPSGESRRHALRHIAALTSQGQEIAEHRTPSAHLHHGDGLAPSPPPDPTAVLVPPPYEDDDLPLPPLLPFSPDEGPSADDRRLSPAPRRQVTPIPVPPSFQAFRAALAAQAPALDPGRPGLRVLLAVGALAVAVAACLVWRSQPTPQPLPPPAPTAPSAPVTAATATAKVTVHVTGKVHEPGVYLLPAGSRVADAVTAAGGASRSAATQSLNLARRLIDGEQIVVGAPRTALGVPAPGPADTVLDLNTATTGQLEQLPGVGEVLAARIAEFRDTHGGFTSVEQLREVSGIGPRKYEEIKPKVRI